ncbi:alpha/beta fold hydrolase [Gordonia sp. TBRC 11910]|uniref:Alpha/beta fold hydrolase n=1 Tax=Gordonia asplenii TaxID=2725283 RepID=A0A848KPT0_9ACTN|nr:alpha/beta fold hydrolase [Gordonia asplenii]NMO00029.1 alpha/beta fold hydrolase [Gordonia asplenii]
MNAARRTDLAARLPAGVTIPDVDVPTGELVELPGRGTTYVTDTPGPDVDAPAILLLHALSTTGLLTWFPSIPALAQRFRVITLDQRLHGRGIGAVEFTLHDCADDAVALLDVLGVEQAMIAGYSMGSLVAQRVWRQHPDRVGGLVLCASTDVFQSTITERIFHRSVGASMAALQGSGARRERAASNDQPEPVDPTDDIHRWALAEFRSTRPRAVAQAVAAIGKHHSRPWIGRITAPTAVVVPLRDKAIPPQRQIAMGRRIPGATIHEFDGGHASCVLNSQAFVPSLMQACATVRARWADDVDAVGTVVGGHA